MTFVWLFTTNLFLHFNVLMNDQLDFECKHGKKNLVFPNLKSKPTMPLDRDFDTKRWIVNFFTCFKRLRFEWHCIETNQMNRNKTKHFGPKHWSIISLLIFHSLNRVRVNYKIWGSWVLFSISRNSLYCCSFYQCLSVFH